MERFKAADPSQGYNLQHGFTLRRVSCITRTVRYEWPGVDDAGKSVTYFCPAFHATLQEWERAHD